MIGSMWSGVTGLRAHQTKLDVIGNDIANVNTVGFKQSEVRFQDAFYQSITSPGDGTAGKQVGLGVSVGKISKDFSGGLLQTTGVASHMALEGDGFFVLKDADGLRPSYTRAGNFDFDYDSAGGTVSLLGPDGRYLYGTAGAAGGTAGTKIELPADMQDMMISSEGKISYIDSAGLLVADAFTVDVATFPGETGLGQIGGNQFVETTASGTPIFGATDHVVVQKHLENSNVDLATEFTEMIIAERGFQANSRTITTSDELLQELLNLKR
jgi:flagellar hook protein FlgE